MIKLGIVGVGKAVLDQHLPAIMNNPDYDLVATASRKGAIEGVPAYLSIEEMVAATSDLDAVALCMPPQYRRETGEFALTHGLHTLLEKPPGASVCEVEQLAELAEKHQKTLFTSWHSRHTDAVQQAKAYLAQREITSVEVSWKENVRKWHPGQDWIWQSGGLGVFDSGINGLSVLTEILPVQIFLQSSRLLFPQNKAAPIAAQLMMKLSTGADVRLNLDWRIEGDEEWTIKIRSREDHLALLNGGARLEINGQGIKISARDEYVSIYQRFSQLIQNQSSEVDLRPMKLTADAFLLGQYNSTEPFEDLGS